MRFHEIIFEKELSTMPDAVMREAKNCRRFFDGHRKLLKGAPTYSDSALTCFCAIASAFLWYRLKKHGYDAHLVVGNYRKNDHCWVELNDQIVDITATQFNPNNPKVYLPISRSGYFAQYRDRAALKALREWGDQAIFLKSNNKEGKYLTYIMGQYQTLLDKIS
jgi:hypothetical protein